MRIWKILEDTKHVEDEILLYFVCIIDGEVSGLYTSKDLVLSNNMIQPSSSEGVNFRTHTWNTYRGGLCVVM